MKKSWVSLVLAAAGTSAGAAQAPSIDRLVDCAAIANAQQRLACFDREVEPFAKVRTQASATAPSSTPRAPTPATTPGGAASATSASSFGNDSLAAKDRKDSVQEPQVLHAKIEKVRPAGTSVYIVYLDNGQAWRHEDEINGSYLREGDAVTINKATLGAYRMTRDAGSSKNWIRVTRVR